MASSLSSLIVLLCVVVSASAHMHHGKLPNGMTNRDMVVLNKLLDVKRCAITVIIYMGDVHVRAQAVCWQPWLIYVNENNRWIFELHSTLQKVCSRVIAFCALLNWRRL